MEKISTFYDKTYLYSHMPTPVLPGDFPTERVCLFVIHNEDNYEHALACAYTFMRRNVRYVCCAGKFGGKVEDAFDLARSEENVVAQNFFPEEGGVLMTTSHESYRDAIRYVKFCAFPTDDKELNTVVCVLLDSTENEKEALIEAIHDVRDGWEPD